jgi:hypothetical protein
MRVTGSVRSESGTELASQSALEGRQWLELAKGAELVVRHGASARELSLRGPGRVLPCRSGLEQVLVASGTLHSSPGTGVRPGAEVWVATPFGALRYADADLELSADKSGLRVKVRGGQVYTEGAQGLLGVKDGRLAGPNGRASASGKPDASALVSSCERAATAASESAKQLLAAKPKELGELAASQLRARRAARGHCLVAEAGVGQLEDSAAKARLGDQLRKFEALWQAIPTQGPKQATPQP